jgi:putative transposase
MVSLGTMKVKKGYHCAYDTHYHIVFPVKYRKGLLEEPVVRALKVISQGLAERYEFELERIGCDVNHVHLLCS